jgi:tetratricopeptide (TPR) repeat protein
MTELTRGDRVGNRYVLVRRLGGGTHGETWLADDAEAQRRVALKLPTASAPPDAAQREAELLRRHTHPAIAAVHGLADLGDGRAALVQEYLPGGDLASLRGRPWQQVLPALRPALDALVALADAGLAHGDLKPANLVRDQDGRAKLVDFGVAVLARAPGAPTGSPHSRSPAQWRGAAPSPADDAWGLGALLYELLAGHPPYYPQVSQARVEHEPVPPLHAPHPVPAALAALVRDLLAKDPDARATVADARATIERVLADAPAAATEPLALPAAVPPRLAPPARGGGGWQPAPAAPGDGVRGRVPASARRGGSPWAIGGGVLLALAAVGTFFVLPRWVERQPVPATAPAAAPAGTARDGATATAPGPAARPSATPAAGPQPLPTDPAALAELAQAKTRAEEARTRYDAALQPLVAARAEAWGGADWTRLQASGADAARAYEARDYAAAAAQWSVGVELAQRVLRARAPALAAALAAGRAGLERGDSRAALAGFERALAIDPKNAAATAGRTRAQNLDRVLALLDEGGNLERAGQPAAAVEKYRAALALDPAAAAASAGIARIAAQGRRDQYAQAMAQGQRAVAQGDRDAARAAFERARALDPQDPSARDALAQLDSGDRTAKLAQLRAQAEAAERDERWAEATKAYEAALALEPTIAFAQQGRARAQPRAELARRLEQYARRQDALATAEDRAAARQLLGVAAAVPGDAPLLRRQAEELDAAIRAAETPVRVALASDNQTEVLVYRVGRLGAFESRELELLPGRYTIVGRRAGFRDVRQEVVVPAGGVVPRVDIRCTDPI